MTAESFRPKFTTSAEAQEENKEQREKNGGNYFGSRVRTVHGSKPPSGVKEKSGRLLKPANKQGMEYSRMPPPGTKARKDIEQREFIAKAQLQEKINKVKPKTKKQKLADKALQDHLNKINEDPRK